MKWLNLMVFGLFAMMVPACDRLNPKKDATFNPDDFIQWSASRKLTWDDFQGQPAKKSQAASELSVDRAAGLSKHLVLPGKATVNCSMNKKLSWADKSKVTDQRLFHHQTEFDLHELYARKLRKRCAESDFGVVDPGGVWTSISRAVFAECDVAMRQFWAETEHGKNLDKLNEWSSKLAQQIKDLEAFQAK